MIQTNETTETKSRTLGFITLMQMIGCLLVIAGHSYPFVTEIPQWLLRIRSFIYCFHMPLFVWCSGFLLIYTRQTARHSFRKYAFRRAKRLLLPYAVFSLLGLVPKIAFSSYLNDSLSLEPMPLVRAFLVPRENIWGHFWFLPMIFLIGMIGYGFSRILDRFGGKAKILVGGGV